MDEVYDAMDSISLASKIAFAQDDIELEARSEAELGYILHKGLKQESKAMVHYHNMVRLVSARKPKDLTDEPWFKKGKEAMNGIQEKRRLEEEAAKDKADAPFRKMVEEDMKKVQAQA